MFKKIWSYKWILLTVCCFILLYTLPEHVIERYYSRGLFLVFRAFFDYTFAFLPFPAYYLFILFCVLTLIRWVLGFFRLNPLPPLTRIIRAFSFIGFMVVSFFLIWGFNYGRTPVEKMLNLQLRPLTTDELSTETDTVLEQLHQARLKIKEDTNTLPQIVFLNNIEDKSREDLNHVLEKNNYPYSDRLRGRFVFDNLFLIFSIGGQYMPYVGEGAVDNAVYYSKKPFYVMHEMAHGNGITGEGDCNFWAYMSCMQSQNVAFQYSGCLNYLFYLLSELKIRDIQQYEKVYDNMPDVIKRDLNEIKEYDKKHTFFTGFLGDVFNTIYLKIMGMPDGVRNYDKLVLLAYAWRHQQ